MAMRQNHGKALLEMIIDVIDKYVEDKTVYLSKRANTNWNSQQKIINGLREEIKQLKEEMN